jgi:hypothetical protein
VKDSGDTWARDCRWMRSLRNETRTAELHSPAAATPRRSEALPVLEEVVAAPHGAPAHRESRGRGTAPGP